MFTFSAEQLLPKRGPPKLNPLPDIQQPIKLQSLPPLQFYIQATQPLTMQQIEQINNRRLQQKLQRYLQQKNNIELQYKRLSEDYNKIKRQYEELKIRYREGEQIFVAMENQNMKLRNQFEMLKKRQEKSKINIGIKKKQVPVVKINVPNPKTISQQNEKQSMYRQLKAASEQLTHMKKMLQSEKQKSQHSQNILNKNHEQLLSQRDFLKNQVNNLRDQNRNLKQQIFKIKGITNQAINPTKNKSFQSNQAQKIKIQFQRLQRIHKSCDILLSAKQTQILNLKTEIQKLKKGSNQFDFNGTWSRQKLKPSGSLLFDKQSNVKQSYEAHTHFPQSSANKPALSDLFQNTHDFNSSYPYNYNSILEQHLDLSVKQMKKIEQFIKSLVKQFIAKIDSLRNQLEWANKKAEHQKFELERVYELLKDKKNQLDNCYNDLKNAGKNKSTPVKQNQIQDQYMKSILKGRRNLSA